MLGGKNAISGLMKKAQEMQGNIQKVQDEIASMQIHGESGGGLVKTIMSGKYELIKLKIDDSLMDDKEMIEDLIAAAVNDSVRKVEETTSKKMGDVGSSMNLPAGMKFPF